MGLQLPGLAVVNPKLHWWSFAPGHLWLVLTHSLAHALTHWLPTPNVGCAGGLAAAVSDLKLRTAVWPEVYYGQLQYLLTLAAAGPQLQFHAIQRAAVSSPVAVSPVYDLSRLCDRAALLLAVVQLYRFLVTVAASLPVTMAPVNKAILTTKNGITTSM